jgi:hypothetical protein
MGLTISYRLSLIAPTIDIVQAKLQALQRLAQDLDFIQVGEIISLQGKDCAIDMNDDGQDPYILLKVHGSEITGVDKKGVFSFRHPSQIIAFTATPGEGCAMADFGMRIYPDQENTQEWTWSSYCKTQYASNPEYGGLDNFITSHLKIVALLDAAESMGIACDVSDNGQYWESRDRTLLASTVNEGNLFTAAIMGAFKNVADSQDATLTAPILDFPNFEHIEAEGQGTFSQQ